MPLDRNGAGFKFGIMNPEATTFTSLNVFQTSDLKCFVVPTESSSTNAKISCFVSRRICFCSESAVNVVVMSFGTLQAVQCARNITLVSQ